MFDFPKAELTVRPSPLPGPRWKMLCPLQRGTFVSKKGPWGEGMIA
jgi:hypothetical protein